MLLMGTVIIRSKVRKAHEGTAQKRGRGQEGGNVEEAQRRPEQAWPFCDMCLQEGPAFAPVGLGVLLFSDELTQRS